MTTAGWKQLNEKDGNFQRPATVLRNFISKEPGSKFPPEKGRYHLYVSYACPWAHRTLIVRKLNGLEDVISFPVVHWHLDLETGWRFPTSSEAEVDGGNVVPDPLHDGFTLLRQIYFDTDPNYSARFSVPVLYDKIQKVIVNNESSEILWMLGTEFDDIIEEKYRNVSLYPTTLQDQIDDAQAWQYDQINHGVYKCGFAVTQDTYEHAVTSVFDGLDRAEAHLASLKPSDGPYWLGKEITEVDIRLFVTLIRFDPIYTFHFKCNIRDIRSGYPRLHNWLRNLYWNVPAFKDTTNFIHIQKGYTKSQANINPLAITAMGPLPHILALEDEVPAVRILK
ncbi:glutathione S-transferase [Colletotrichum graminicola]|uniref:Glutathione S-transferase n=1 Tax=Colletotrichum graminicola (strain M1.001 / M2 / FGSC 10212) TaxID=645133 RepID=E3QI74_COLGM|nr:glutathione S-transferase [Colletotrichum graminicola M1.001]EFQ30689.1 glutathione S-transferase [Colletotrichum graminicola M1.001]WDK21426.1 glutathione S-transferase [Colletotrichum graminicola]